MTSHERAIRLFYKVETGTRRTRTLLSPAGVTIFSVFTAAFVLAALWLDRLLGSPALLPEWARLPVAAPEFNRLDGEWKWNTTTRGICLWSACGSSWPRSARRWRPRSSGRGPGWAQGADDSQSDLEAPCPYFSSSAWKREVL